MLDLVVEAVEARLHFLKALAHELALLFKQGNACRNSGVASFEQAHVLDESFD